MGLSFVIGFSSYCEVMELAEVLLLYFFCFRYSQYKKMRDMIDKYEGGLDAFSRGYEKFGFIRR